MINFLCSWALGIAIVLSGTPALTQETKTNDTLGIVIPYRPSNLSSPTHGFAIADLYVGHVFFEGLMVFDFDNKVVLGLANKYEVSPDGLTHKFHIHPEARFSNGEKVTARDVVFSFRHLAQNIADGKVADRGVIASIKEFAAIKAGLAEPEILGVRALSPSMVEIELERVDPVFVYSLADREASILHAESVEADPEGWSLTEAPATSGAYSPIGAFGSDIIIAEKNKFYHKPEPNSFDKLALYFHGPETSTLALFLSTGADMALRIRREVESMAGKIEG